MSDILGEFISPTEMAKRLGISERYLRKFAKETGYYRKFGGKMLFLQEDVSALMEASKPWQKPKVSSSTRGVISGIIEERSVQECYEEARRLMKRKRHPNRRSK